MSQRLKTNTGLRKEDRATSSPHEEKGQSLLEMAFALPVLLLLLALAIDVGRVFDASIVLTNAVREGARYATIEPSPTIAQIQTMVVQDVVGSGTNISQIDDITTDQVNVLMGTTAITVTASYDFDLWFGGLLGIPTLAVSKQSVMPLYLPGTSP
jgi:hypothetical protein